VHDKLPGCLCHATQASAWGYLLKGLMFDMACLHMHYGYLGIRSSLGTFGQEFQSVTRLCIYAGLPLDVAPCNMCVDGARC
jgi:hypothetical protein